jgi:O-antigen biosynthesis protein
MWSMFGKKALKPTLENPVATKQEGKYCWQSLHFPHSIPAGKWLTLRLYVNVFEPLVRPVIRFRTVEGEVAVLMSAPLWGVATWIGYIPVGTVNVAISTGHLYRNAVCAVAECFELTSLRMAFEFVRRDLISTYIAAVLWIIGNYKSARWIARRILEETKLQNYHEWRANRIRPLDLGGVDQPTAEAESAPHIWVVIDATNVSAKADLLSTLESLRAQSYSKWTALVVGMKRLEFDLINFKNESQRTWPVPSFGGLRELLTSKKFSLFTVIAVGDHLPAYCLEIVADYADGHPSAQIIYGDSDSQNGETYRDPELKPDWSPIFLTHSDYIGRSIFFRTDLLENEITISKAIEQKVVRIPLRTEENAEVAHLRRVLLTRVGSDKADFLLEWSSRKIKDKTQTSEISDYLVSIIIPTRDRAHLLAGCLSCLKNTQSSNFEIIIVDNGSVEPATFQLYRELATEPNVRVEVCPGPFNFSSLCNRGARASRGAMLVFLNNDTLAFDPGWLAGMLKWATNPSVGAVGVKLLYPSMKVQHAGIILGLYGIAGHIGLGASQWSAGYLNRLVVPHEISAVTGACLAVEKRKFNAVGGFDEAAFPVDLNDVDLCLRLSQMGWKTVFASYAKMVHLESASRGQTKTPETTYELEQLNFRLRWDELIHDDPYFHPSLSLRAPQVRLV